MNETDVALDAIIVPTVRHSRMLRQALSLGHDLQCPVLVLCSRWSRIRDAVRLARRLQAQIIAAEVNGPTKLPNFYTSRLLAQKEISEGGDLSLKRNIGLAMARMLGWQHFLYLDDDIEGIDPADVRAAVAHLSDRPVVALENVGYPDNSVVCHAIRRVQRVTGVSQETFVGGGAMAMTGATTNSFFPAIYNEDWFFMLQMLSQDAGPRQVGSIGTVAQQPYDPFVRPERARTEEFGDCLGEGLYALLDDNTPLSVANDQEYWGDFLADRGMLLERIMAAIKETKINVAERQKITDCLKAAQGRHRFITPELCVRYLNAWRADMIKWQKYVADLPDTRKPEVALRHLGLEAA